MLCKGRCNQNNDNKDNYPLLGSRELENIFHQAFAYLIGSFTPASRKPFKRS